MKKCEVLKDTTLSIKAGSIVLVEDRQYELARRVLKPVEKPAEKKEKAKKEK